MENKTISQLNSKTWFRMLKVVCVLAFLVFIVGYNFVIFNNGKIKTLDLDKTLISCEKNSSGNIKKFNLRETGLYFGNSELDNYKYSDFFTNNPVTAEAISVKCLPNPPVGQRGYTLQELQAMGATPVQPQNITTLPLNLKEYQFFDIAPKFSYSSFIENFLIGNLLIILGFILLRNIFYYIILGSFRPAK